VSSITEIIARFVPNISIQYVDAKIMNQLSNHVDCKRFQKACFAYRGDLMHGIQDKIELLKAVCSWRAWEFC
jgi:hypothetical protein